MTLTHKIQMKYIELFFLWCSGTDMDIINRCPRKVVYRQIMYGVLLFIPTIMAFFSLSYLLKITINEFPFYVPIIWALIIFFIDRFFILTLNKSKSIDLPFFLSALTRIVLAIVIGYIIAHPIVLIPFQESINEKFEENQIIEIDSFYIPKIDSVQAKIDRNQNEIKRYNDLYFNQTQNGTDEYNKLNTQNQISLLNYRQNTWRRDLKDLKFERNEKLEQLKKPNDFWLQLRTLEEIKKENEFVIYLEILLIIFFIVLDTVPILGKIFSKRNLYDIYVTQREEMIQSITETFSSYIKSPEMQRVITSKVNEEINNSPDFVNSLEGLSQVYKSLQTRLIKIREIVQLKNSPLTKGFDSSHIFLDDPIKLDDKKILAAKNVKDRVIIILFILAETLIIMIRKDYDPAWLAIPALTFSLSHFLIEVIEKRRAI